MTNLDFIAHAQRHPSEIAHWEKAYGRLAKQTLLLQGSEVTPFLPLVDHPLVLLRKGAYDPSQEPVIWTRENTAYPGYADPKLAAIKQEIINQIEAGNSNFFDEFTIRITGVGLKKPNSIEAQQSPGNGFSLTLTAQPVQWSDYFASNIQAERGDNIQAKNHADILQQWGGKRPREVLAPYDENVILSQHALCANHLGVCALVVTSDGYVFLSQNSASGVAVGQGQIVPPVSGTANWPLLPDGSCDPNGAARLSLAFQLLEEFCEEQLPGQYVQKPVKMDRAAYAKYLSEMEQAMPQIVKENVRDLVINAIVQDLSRGGLPELFGLIFSPKPLAYFQQLQNSSEHSAKVLTPIPSPVTSIDTLAEGEKLERAVFALQAAIEDPRNSMRARTALHYLGEYAKLLQK